MSSLKRLIAALVAPTLPRGGEPATPTRGEDADRSVNAGNRPAPETDASLDSIPVPTLEDIVRVEEVDDARFFVDELFQRRFGSRAPDYPRHFVCFHKQDPSHFTALGYIHYSPYENCWLCGGMVMDDRAYRRLPAAHRTVIRDHGGVAEIMLRHTFALLKDSPAIWGYVGDKLAELVDLRAGFVHTGRKHLMVVWNRELPQAHRHALIEKIASLGPF